MCQENVVASEQRQLNDVSSESLPEIEFRIQRDWQEAFRKTGSRMPQNADAARSFLKVFEPVR